MKGRRVEGRKKSLNQDLHDYGITMITNFPAQAFFLPEGRLTLRAQSQELRAVSYQLIMVLRPHQETNESQHHRFAQHIGSPRRGAEGKGKNEYRK